MELIDKVKTSNDFGLRKRFPWTGLNAGSEMSWREKVQEDSEISFVKDLLSPIFHLQTPTIWRVENPYLWASYVLAYEELDVNSSYTVSERYVIHSTSLNIALRIAEENFNWRLVRRARFGRGVSFASNASYAKKYASGKNVYIIAGIPVGNTTYGYYSTMVPSSNVDTTMDSRGNVYVKYYDSDFYPYYIAY